MKSREHISNELREISSFMAGIEKINPYNVPEGYFAQLPHLILSNMQQREDRVNEISSELTVVAPLLNTISKQRVQAVPPDYFNQVNFAAPVLQQQRKPAKVINLPSAGRWMPMTVAAVITGIVITGAFMFTNNRDSHIEYEKYTHTDIPAGLTEVSEADIEKYLNEPEHTVLTQPVTVSVTEEEFFDVTSTIQLLSDEVLTQYITENADLIEPAAEAKNK